MAKSGNKPVHEVRYRNVKAAIWLNQTAKGTMHNVTVCRSYRDGETWKNANSFGPADLLPLAKALNEAHSWIHEQMAAARNPSSRGDEGRKTGLKR